MSNQVRIKTIDVGLNGINVFYREAGAPEAPVILLLHGFPSSSHQFRNLIPILAKKYRVIVRHPFYNAFISHFLNTYILL
jgi:pimeloyl-ACP methyl ester carboxylesterase